MLRVIGPRNDDDVVKFWIVLMELNLEFLIITYYQYLMLISVYLLTVHFVSLRRQNQDASYVNSLSDSWNFTKFCFVCESSNLRVVE